MSRSEGEAASFLEQLLSSIRIVKVFQASKPLVGCYDNHLGKIQKDSKFIAFSKGLTYAGSYSAIFFCYSLACEYCVLLWASLPDVSDSTLVCLQFGTEVDRSPSMGSTPES